MGAHFNNGIDLTRLIQGPVIQRENREAVETGVVAERCSGVGDQNDVVVRLADLISKVTRFQFSERVSIVWKPGNLWSVFDAGLVLNADGDWEFEPMGTSRTPEFKARTRFSLDDAFARAERDASGGRS